jgi:hypothetical protein
MIAEESGKIKTSPFPAIRTAKEEEMSFWSKPSVETAASR